MSMPSTYQGGLESSPSFDEHKWVIQIRQTLDEPSDGEDSDDIPISIFDVPKLLMAEKPETYTPQHVAIGPYHQWRTELYEMERYKLCAARRTQKQLQSNLRFENIVEHFSKHEFRIRACYHKFLDFNGETLAWMMAVDAAFIIDFLQIYGQKSEANLSRVSSRLSVDYAGNTCTHNAMVRDMLMLENQIPFFLLREMLCFSNPKIEESLGVMLNGFYREVSPFKNLDNFPSFQELIKREHLLELLYYMIMPKQQDPIVVSEIQEHEIIMDSLNGFSHFFSFISNSFSSIRNSKPITCLGRVLKSTKLIDFVKVSLQFLIKSTRRSQSTMKPFMNISNSVKKSSSEIEIGIGSSFQPPLADEIQIPSVAELCNVGVRFCATKGDLTTIKFDKISQMFYLPTITLDENSDVILRNLVAFEACAVGGALVFTRYTELMNGIIDTEEDVRLLRAQGVLLNHLRSDDEVANVWNSMSRSLRLTKVDFLDKVIEDVNKYYNSRWKVRGGKLMKKYVFASWPILTFLAANLLLVATCLQAFCSMYNCSRISFKVAGNVV